jgi:hypothetical protein
MPREAFPFSPRSATQLQVGDLIPVGASSGTWSCLQVLELKPRARNHFVIGTLPWCGDRPPRPEDVLGLVPLERALTRIEIFTRGGLHVIGNAEPNDGDQERWHGPAYIGKSTRVWGWQAAIGRAQAVCASPNDLASERPFRG